MTCTEYKKCCVFPFYVTFPCNHTACLCTFKEDSPRFPYPEIEIEYRKSSLDPKWDAYPLISEYHKEYNQWILKDCPMNCSCISSQKESICLLNQ